MEPPLEAKCSCQHCENHIAFPIELAEATADCPHCGQPTQLSLKAPPPASSLDRPSATEIIGAFGPAVARTPVSFTYKIGLVLATFVMLVLLLIYPLLIAAAAYGVYAYAVNFKPTEIGFNPLRSMLSLVPVLFGAVIVFFMIKPLCARRPRRLQPLALDPGINAKLYAFVAKVCESVGAPMPKRIDLTCELNAAAGLRRGFGSLMEGDDLVLMIGLPLVAGLNLREFAGVMAHEFGHFAQGFGMRLSYLVRWISGWFARVVYEHDAWDAWLQEVFDQAADGRMMFVAGCIQLCVKFTRCFLFALMWCGHAVCCFLLRQMEFDADSYEIKVAGSATTERTMIKLNVLALALKRTYKEIRATWNTNRKLPEDFPAFFRYQESKIPKALRQKLEDSVGLSRTKLFSTHPSDGDRIRRARRADEPGVFVFELPATVLFANFEVVARQITLLHYRDDLGLDCDGSNLRPMEFYTRVPST